MDEDRLPEGLRCWDSLELNGSRSNDAFRFQVFKYGFWYFHVLIVVNLTVGNMMKPKRTAKCSIGGGMSSPSTKM